MLGVQGSTKFSSEPIFMGLDDIQTFLLDTVTDDEFNAPNNHQFDSFNYRFETVEFGAFRAVMRTDKTDGLSLTVRNIVEIPVGTKISFDAPFNVNDASYWFESEDCRNILGLEDDE